MEKLPKDCNEDKGIIVPPSKVSINTSEKVYEEK